MNLPDVDPDHERARRHSERRRKATVQGRHLPTNEELLTGFPFLKCRIELDAQSYVERALPRIKEVHDPHGHARRTLKALTVSPGVHEYLDAAEALQIIEEGVMPRTISELVSSARFRCLFYAAALADRDAARLVAVEAAKRMELNYNFGPVLLDFATAALGWLHVSGLKVAPYDGAPTRAWNHGNMMMSRLHALALVSDEPAVASKPSESQGQKEPLAVVPGEPKSEATRVILKEIGNPDTTEGRRVSREFYSLIGQSMPLRATPDLVKVRSDLVTEFPYAMQVIDQILPDLVTAKFLRMRPTIFVGTPGSGKTTFAFRLLEVLGVPSTTYSCGGVSDSSIAGTPRRWSTGEPSLPVSLIRRWSTASPGLILDEIEKAGTSRHNGALVDVLLGLWEQQSSSAWHDPYIEAEVDLSHVLWLATANSLDGVPGPLRDRSRVIKFPEPSAEHLQVLAAALTLKIGTAQGLDARWVAPLDPEEMDALRRYWPGGSIRRLGRLIEALLRARGHDQRQH